MGAALGAIVGVGFGAGLLVGEAEGAAVGVGAGFDGGEPVGLGALAGGVADDVHADATRTTPSVIASSWRQFMPDRARAWSIRYTTPDDDPITWRCGPHWRGDLEPRYRPAHGDTILGEVMIFSETALNGAFIVDLERREDDRGFFARVFCQREFMDHGLEPLIAQANIAWSARSGTLRGMHFQFPPAAETKYVRCTRGAVLDIIVDLRPESPTYLEHTSVELTEENRRGIYVPRRFAHGYQALTDGAETTYIVGEFYSPVHEGGLRFDDPRLGLEWPLPIADLSAKDAGWRSLDEIEPELKRLMAPGGGE